MTTLRAESPSTVLRATCPKVFKLTFLHSEMTRTSILLTQAEGLSDEQRIKLGQLAELPDREAFWDLFNESVSPPTSYRIESHTLQMQPNLFEA
jgi:hypothetical protein